LLLNQRKLQTIEILLGRKKFKKKTLNPKPDDIYCTCGQKGHWSPICPQKGKKDGSSRGSGSRSVLYCHKLHSDHNSRNT